MRRLGLHALLAVAGLSLASPVRAQSVLFSEIEQGRKLAIAGDCVACHTEPGGQPFAGGLPLDTPFGRILSANITPDREHGIGAWTDDQFVRAMQHGVGSKGEYLYPAFPYTAYTKVRRSDILAIRAYLNTIEPANKAVVTDQLPFPFNIRMSMLAWNMLFLKAGEFKPDLSKPEDWNRGAYLVQGLGHCGTCHTPKDFLGGDKSGSYLQGGVLEGWFAPDITGDAHGGLGGWSVSEVATYLKTGRNAHAAAAGPMGEVVHDSTSHMDDADLEAIAVYLKSVPGNGEAPPTPLASGDSRMARGSEIYDVNCAACHVGSGAGVPDIFPPLKGNASVQSTDPATLIHVVLQGARGVSTPQAVSGMAMPSFAWRLTNQDVADVLSFVRNKWGNSAAPVAPSDVAAARSSGGSAQTLR